MPSKYQTLRIFTETLWQKDCPVLLEKSALLYDRDRKLHLLQFKFRNIQSRVINSLYIRISFFDPDNLAAPVTVGYRYDILQAAGQEHFGSQSPVYISNTVADGFQLIIESITFEDGSTWTGSTPLTPLPAPEFISSLGVYGETFIQEVHKLKAISCMNLPTDRGEFWYCACGTVNGKDETHCINCGFPKNVIFKLRDPAYLKECKQIADAEQKRVEEEKEAERLKKQQAEFESRQRRKKRLIRTAVICGILIIAFSIGLLSYKVLYPNYRYHKALSYMEQGNYGDAQSIFEGLGDYKDSGKRNMEAKYRYAGFLAENSEYDAALACYKELEGYKDVSDRITSVYYNMANSYVEHGNYSEALKIYQNLGNYEDSAERIPATKYLMANAAMESHDYETAYGLYSELSDYKDVPDRMNECTYQYAGLLLEQGNYQEAIDQYKNVYHYKDSAKLQDVAKFSIAKKLFEEKNYEECYAALDDLKKSLKDLEGGMDMYMECCYQVGLYYLKIGDTEDGLGYFQFIFYNEDYKEHYIDLLEKEMYDKIAEDKWDKAALMRMAFPDDYQDPALDEEFYIAGKQIYNSFYTWTASNVFEYLASIDYKDSRSWLRRIRQEQDEMEQRVS